MYAASAIAANTVCRSAAGSTAPLFTNYMFDALGIGGGGSLIGGVAALLAVIPFAFYRYGERIRVRSRFAPTGQRPEQPPGDEEKATSRQEEFMRPESRASSSSASSAAESFSSDTLATDRERNAGVEKERRKDEDVPQNELGEPRDENVAFGKETKG